MKSTDPASRHSARPLLTLALLGVALLLLALLPALLNTRVALAQDAEPLSAEALEAARQQISNDEVNSIARELWCPLCSGVRLDSCELRACEQMKDVIRIKLADGEGLDTIRDYFVNQYGPQVLGAPPTSGFNLLAWVLPVLVLVGGGLYLALRLRKSTQRGPEPAAVTPGSAATPAQAAIDDEYARRLEEELRKYE